MTATEQSGSVPDGRTSASSSSDASDDPLHLLSVRNPSYADDAMDEHLRVLLDWAARRSRGRTRCSADQSSVRRPRGAGDEDPRP